MFCSNSVNGIIMNLPWLCLLCQASLNDIWFNFYLQLMFSTFLSWPPLRSAYFISANRDLISYRPCDLHAAEAVSRLRHISQLKWDHLTETKAEPVWIILSATGVKWVKETDFGLLLSQGFRYRRPALMTRQLWGFFVRQANIPVFQCIKEQLWKLSNSLNHDICAIYLPLLSHSSQKWIHL